MLLYTLYFLPKILGGIPPIPPKIPPKIPNLFWDELLSGNGGSGNHVSQCTLRGARKSSHSSYASDLWTEKTAVY